MSRSERIRKRGRQPSEVFTEISVENDLMDTLGIQSAQVDAKLGDESAGNRLNALEVAVAEIADGLSEGSQNA